MADATMRARRVRILLEPKDDTGLYFATSPDLKGFLVSETSPEARNRAIPQAISDLYKACGVDVVVTKLDDPADEGVEDYVAMRAEIAQQALDARAS
jgi:hypothetical protein